MAWMDFENKEPVKRRKAPWVRGVLAGLAALIGAAGLWFWLGTGSEESPEERPVRPRTVRTPRERPARPAKPVVRKAPEVPVVVTNRLSREEILFQKTNGYVKAAGRMLTEDGRILTFPPPKEGEFRIVHTHGKTYRCDSQGNFVDVTPKPIFDNAFEQGLVGMAVEGGAFIPGMLTGHNPEDVMAMLQRPVQMNADDPPEIAEKKLAVAELKTDILNYISQGGTFDEYVNEMRDKTARQRMLTAQATRDIVQMLMKNRGADAVRYREKYNDLVGKAGMKPLRLPSHIDNILKNEKEKMAQEERK